MLYDDFVRTPAETLRTLFGFLGVDAGRANRHARAGTTSRRCRDSPDCIASRRRRRYARCAWPCQITWPHECRGGGERGRGCSRRRPSAPASSPCTSGRFVRSSGPSTVISPAGSIRRCRPAADSLLLSFQECNHEETKSRRPTKKKAWLSNGGRPRRSPDARRPDQLRLTTRVARSRTRFSIRYTTLTGWSEAVAAAGARVTVLFSDSPRVDRLQKWHRLRLCRRRRSRTVRGRGPGRAACIWPPPPAAPDIVHVNGLIFPVHTCAHAARRCRDAIGHRRSGPWQPRAGHRRQGVDACGRRDASAPVAPCAG